MSATHTPIVDVWAQISTERMAQAPWFATLRRWTGANERPPTVETTLEAMDAAGVDVSLISAWSSPAGDLISNEELTDQIDAAPDRFRGLLTVDLRDPMRAVATIRELGSDDRFVGVRIVPWVWELAPNHRWYYPLYVACVEMGLPFCTQIGHTGPLRGSEYGKPIPYLEEVLLDFPELVVVAGHVGAPWLHEVATLCIKFPNFHLDTSAYALHRLPPEFVALWKGVARGRVMFGTNWPMLAPERCLAGLDSLDLNPEARESFLSGAAQRVFGLD